MQAFVCIQTLILVLLSGSAFADGGGCAVPVCNPGDALTKFQASSSQDQYALMQRYIVIANHSQDSAILVNLNTFAGAAKSALVALKADRTVIDATNQLSTVCIERLSLYSDLNADTLMEYYRQINLEATRYEVLAAWSARIKDYEERGPLLELAKFFASAGKLSVELEDDDYLETTAKTSEQAASKKLARVQPFLEGVYAVQVTCETGAACPESAIDRMVILDGLSSGIAVVNDLSVNLVASDARVSVFRFSSVKLINGVSTIEGFGANPGGEIAKLHLNFDQANASLSGELETDEFRFKISATLDPSASLNALFDKQYKSPLSAPLSPSMFDQKLVGTYAGKRVELKVNVFPKDPSILREESVGATMTFNDMPGLKLRFRAGQFFPKAGLLLLVGDTPGLGTIKIGLTIRPGDADSSIDGSAQYVLSGFSFGGDSAMVNQVSLATTSSTGGTP